MESRFERQLKKGALEMLVLGLVCAGPTYGYELLGSIAGGSCGLCRTTQSMARLRGLRGRI